MSDGDHLKDSKHHNFQKIQPMLVLIDSKINHFQVHHKDHNPKQILFHLMPEQSYDNFHMKTCE